MEPNWSEAKPTANKHLIRSSAQCIYGITGRRPLEQAAAAAVAAAKSSDPTNAGDKKEEECVTPSDVQRNREAFTGTGRTGAHNSSRTITTLVKSLIEEEKLN